MFAGSIAHHRLIYCTRTMREAAVSALAPFQSGASTSWSPLKQNAAQLVATSAGARLRVKYPNSEGVAWPEVVDLAKSFCATVGYGIA